MQNRYETEMEWPPDIPDGLRDHLEKLASDLRGQTRTSVKDMKADAAQLKRAAQKTLKLAQKFRHTYWLESFEENAKSKALKHFDEQMEDATEEDRELFLAGMGQESLDMALIGLATHMSVLASTVGKKSRPKAHLERYAAGRAIDLFRRFGLETSAQDGSTLIQACTVLLRRAGMHERYSEPDAKHDGEDAIKHYLKEFTTAKNG